MTSINVFLSFVVFVAMVLFVWSFVYWFVGREYKIVENEAYEIGSIGVLSLAFATAFSVAVGYLLAML